MSPLEYLKELERARLPLTVTEPPAIRLILMLRAALLINACERPPREESGLRSAVVTDVTPTGWSLLGKLKDDERVSAARGETS